MSELPVGTVLQAGDAAPPTNSEKAASAGIWAAVPAVLAALSTWLASAPQNLPNVDPQVWTWVGLLMTLLTPLAGYYGAYRKANTLTQPVQVVAAPGAPAPPMPGDL